MSFATLLRDTLLRAFRQAGWAGWAGLALFALAAVLHLVAVPATEARLRALGAERARLLQNERSAGGGVSPAQVPGLVESMPAAAELPQVLTRVHALAAAHGLDLSRGDYRTSSEPAIPFVRVAVQLPVHGDFEAVHGWLSELLVTMPAVGLESLAVRRSDPQIVPVDADVRLVMFARRSQ